jgi:heptose I phosphotransferase
MEADLGSDPFNALMQISGQVYRKQPGRETSRVLIQDRPYFIKKHWGISLGECVKNIFSGRLPIIGAKTEWKAIQALTDLGLGTTPLVGYGQRGFWPFTQQSFVLTQALDETISLEDDCKDWAQHPPAFADKKALILELARITRILHEAGWVHRDLYLCHFLRDKDRVLHLIDLHRMIRPRVFKTRWIIKDLSALLFSSLDYGLTRRDALRFLKAYTQLPLDQALKAWGPRIDRILHKASQLYEDAHRAHPPQPWVSTDARALPHKTGAYTGRFLLEGHEFQGERALRVLPRRRWVLKGQWQGRLVVVKLFSEQKEFDRECKAAKALAQHKILAPELLQVGSLGHLFAIIYAYIDQPQRVESCDEPLIHTLAQLHEAGLIQEDCHRDNFLSVQELIYVIDAGGIRFSSQHPLGERKSLQNLALLFAQWPQSQDKAHLPLFAVYGQARGWSDLPRKQTEFLRVLTKIRKKTLHAWLNKIFRNCSTIRIKPRFFQQIIIRRDFDTLHAQTLCAHPEAYFHGSAPYLKQGNSTTVVRATIGDREVVIKRYNRKNAVVRLKRYFSRSKAARAWKNAHTLESFGLMTPQPLAIIEKKLGPLHLDSYFVCAYLPMERLNLAQQDYAAALVAMMQVLKASHCQHGDLKFSNLLWDGKQLVIVDLDALKVIGNSKRFAQAHEADWARLLRNWQEYPAFQEELRRLKNAGSTEHG